MIFANSLSLLALAAAGVSASGSLQPPKTEPVKGQLTSQGCFDSLPAGASGEKLTFASSGTCAEKCAETKSLVVILQADKCYCTDTYPARSSRVDDDDQCDTPCPGYSLEACGGENTYSVYNAGVEVAVKYDDGDASSSSSSASSSASASTTSSAVASTASTAATTSAAATPSSTDSQASSDASTPVTTAGDESTASPSAATTTSDAGRRLSSPIGQLALMVKTVFKSFGLA